MTDREFLKALKITPEPILLPKRGDAGQQARPGRLRPALEELAAAIDMDLLLHGGVLPTYDRLEARCAALSEERGQLLDIQRRLIEQRNLWYLRWKRATCAFFIVVAIVVVGGIVEVVFS